MYLTKPFIMNIEHTSLTSIVTSKQYLEQEQINHDQDTQNTSTFLTGGTDYCHVLNREELYRFGLVSETCRSMFYNNFILLRNLINYIYVKH